MKLLGIAEVARATRQRPATVAQWYKRGKLPKPIARLAMGPVWTERAIAHWIKLNTRRVRTPASTAPIS
jgi:predicted DNA-binding transcriptional regulator AlpA